MLGWLLTQIWEKSIIKWDDKLAGFDLFLYIGAKMEHESGTEANKNTINPSD